MASLKYNKVYSRLFTKIEAYDFIELSEDTLNEFLCNWLHSATANPYVRRLFKSFSVDDEIQTITYEMKYSIDELTDEEFVTEILTFGVAISWLEPKVNSITNISQMFGSKDEKLRELLLTLTVRCIWKHCSVFLRICWNTLRAVTPKRKDEICLNGMV